MIWVRISSPKTENAGRVVRQPGTKVRHRTQGDMPAKWAFNASLSAESTDRKRT